MPDSLLSHWTPAQREAWEEIERRTDFAEWVTWFVPWAEDSAAAMNRPGPRIMVYQDKAGKLQFVEV